MDERTIAALIVAAVALYVVVAWLIGRWLRRSARKPTPYGKPSHTSDAMWWFWQELQKLEPDSALGGTYASKSGYHNFRDALPSYDYSVCDRPPDDGGPGDVCAAIDWTFYDAQRGDYSTISKYTKRLIDSGKDPDDPRMNGWREVYGNADSDTYVEGFDFRYQRDVTSDSSHLWHIHLSESRDQSESYDNKKACLSVLRGETVDEWLGTTILEGGGVLLNCPYDETRLDLFYVGPDGAVIHRWWNGGIRTPWSSDTKNESLGGSVHVGTLTASWAPDGQSLNIAGLGEGDSNCPPDCGQYWGMNLARGGGKSGWGSFEKAYGRLPVVADLPPAQAQVTALDKVVLGVVVVAMVLASIALVYAIVTA